VTAFTDDCPGLRSIDPGRCRGQEAIDSRLVSHRHADAARNGGRQRTIDGRSRSNKGEGGDYRAGRAPALAHLVRQGAKNAQRSIDRIRKVMHTFNGECGHGTRGLSSRKLWCALHEVDRYLGGQSAWLVNYAERLRAGLRVGTSITEGTANFLVNRRMNKAQQMRWSRRGASLLLQVRCSVYNGTLRSEFGHQFEVVADRGMIPQPLDGPLFQSGHGDCARPDAGGD